MAKHTYQLDENWNITDENGDYVGNGTDSLFEVECTNDLCGYTTSVEPDCSVTCPECRTGKLESPLRAMELI